MITAAEADLLLRGDPWARARRDARIAERARREQSDREREQRRREHEQRLAAIRREGEARVVAIRAEWASLRRTDEDLSNRVLDSRILLHRLDRRRWERFGRTIAGAQPPTLSLDLATGMLERALQTCAPDGRARAYEAHILQLCATHRIEPQFVVRYFGQGIALTDRRIVELVPIRSAFTYSTALHEIGHVVHPCDKVRHVRVPKTDKTGTVCVPCELEAWRFAIETARPRWTRVMHANLARALGTYGPYATDRERAAIERLSSSGEFRCIQVDQARRDLALAKTA